ncbi:NUDIX domain-containing protein [Candidatus Uhrbacteria bacterium]|nr:NUDIX domain-containing protein [Candidatus Uhrbacteria bacterium]
MPASEISLDKAKNDKLFYFVANVVVYRESDRRCLLLKRSETEKVHPGKYAVPGGKLEWKDLDISHPTRMNGDVIDFEDALEDLLKRETREEAGIEICGPYAYINSVAYIRPDGIPVVMVKLAARYLSGEVKLESGSFSGSIWANADEAISLPCISGIPDEIKKTMELMG